jgi:ABC-type multidrug transport system fused ATPase/permease subunit
MIQDPNIKRIEIVPQLLGLFGFNLLKAIVSGQEFFIGRRVGTRGRVAIIDEIYKKSLHRVQGASADDEKASLGKIVTLMSVDTEQIRMMLSISPQFLIAVPISIAVSISSLYLVVGWSAIVGILIVLFIIPLSKALAAAMIKYQKERLENTGKRVAAMNEMLQGIRIVKYFGWENHFLKKIGEIRVKELNSIMRLWAVFIGLGTLGSGSGIFISFATFAVYALIAGNNLDARTAFTAVYLLGVVSQSLTFLPAQVAQVLKAKVSLDRIQDYLKEQDIDKYTSEEPLVASDSKTTIGFKNAELRYHGNDVNDSNSINFTLRNVNVEFPTGKLSVIAGSTGSGKTSLLLGLLGGIIILI